MKKDKIVLMVLILIVVVVVIAINYTQSTGEHDPSTIDCIADNSLLIVSKTCGHCANQIETLGDYKDDFEILYVDDDPSLLETYNLRGVPAWIINNKTYTGVRSIENLKELTECDLGG